MIKRSLLLIALGSILTLEVTAQTTQEQNKQPIASSLPAQLVKVLNAPQTKRVELMNQFKERIASMSIDQREAAIQLLHRKIEAALENKNTKDQQSLEKVQNMLIQMQAYQNKIEEHQAQIQEHTRQMQQNLHMEMERNEHMNQKEAAEQYQEHILGHMQESMDNPTSSKANNSFYGNDSKEIIPASHR